MTCACLLPACTPALKFAHKAGLLLEFTHPSRSGGFRDCVAWDQNHLRGPCLKIFC